MVKKTMMTAMKYPEPLLHLINALRRLPGVGSKSAERFAFQLLTWQPENLRHLAELIKDIPEKLKYCEECGCLRGEDSCRLCDPSKRNVELICVIASPKDAFSIEQTAEYKGVYHVLGGLLSPLDQIGPTQLSIAALKNRIERNRTQEIVIAIDSTLEGDATALFLKQELAAYPLKISRLAFGIPMGSSLDYVDGGTLARAFTGRLSF